MVRDHAPLWISCVHPALISVEMVSPEAIDGVFLYSKRGETGSTIKRSRQVERKVQPFLSSNRKRT